MSPPPEPPPEDAAGTRHQREFALFEAASELPPRERTAYVRAAAGDDEELARRVLALLQHEEDEGPDALDGSAAQALAASLSDAAVDTPKSIGGYRILRELGRGGMGVVYEAEQLHPRRLVAVKVMGEGLVTEEHVRRFEHEVRVLGWLEHPGLARIFEAGLAKDTGSPRPFFAMELVRGRPLRAYADEEGLSSRARLDLVARICDAVQHAHQKGVVHRDLKPSNVLVEANGQPKVLDFGVARVTDTELETRTLETQPGQLLGTLPYMSPEQVAGDPTRIDTRTDVYALGVIAYELLSGSLPLVVSGRQLAEAARVIQEDEPSSLGAVDRRWRGDVETIVAKAIEKDPKRRYASAEELANDIRRFLADEPIEARPPSAGYQLRKFARRNRALVAGVVGVFGALAIGLVVSLVLYRESETRGVRLAEALVDAESARAETQTALRQEQDAREEADAARRSTEQALYELRSTEDWFDGFFAAASPDVDGSEVRVVEVLDRVAAGVADAFPDRPLARARLLRRIGATYRDIGMPERGFRFLEQASELVANLPDAPSEDALRIGDELATGLRRLDRYDEAIALYREQLARREQLGLGEAPVAINNHVALAQSLTMGSRLDEAQEVAERALELTRGLDDPEAHVEKRISVHEALAAIAMQRGRFPDARREIEVAADLYARHDPGSWGEANTLLLAGQIATYQSRFEDAEELLWRAFEQFQGLIGDDHHASLAGLEALGVVYLQTDRHDEALETFRSALDMCNRMFDGPHGSRATLRSHIGLIHMQGRRFEEAEAQLVEAVAEFRVVGPGGLELSSALSNLANTLERAGRHEEALPHIEEALRLREAQADPNHFRIGWDYDVLARIFEGLGEPESAAFAQARADEIEAWNREHETGAGQR